MKTRTTYVAFDGKEFDTEAACRTYESSSGEMRLVGLTLEQVRSAISREDADLADVIEKLGVQIGKARREAGDLKRKPKSSPEVQVQASYEDEAA